MLKARIIYFCLIIFTVFIGLVSRELKDYIPLFIGDILWGLVIFMCMRLLFIKQQVNVAVITSLVYCYATEFSQLYEAPWINDLRHTFFGRVMLGKTFLLSDMLCYTIGIGLGILLELSLRRVVRTLYVIRD
jgi:hypothetical protein